MHVGKTNLNFTYKLLLWADYYQAGWKSWGFSEQFDENIISILCNSRKKTVEY